MNYLQKLYKALKLSIGQLQFISVKLVPSLEPQITFDERFKGTSVPFFIPDCNLLSCEY